MAKLIGPKPRQEEPIWPTPWKVAEDGVTVKDANGVSVSVYSFPELAELVVEIVNREASKPTRKSFIA